MGETTGIGWTDHTASPWWGCLKVSPGCEHCYAETLAVTRRKLPVWGPPSTTERKRIASAIPNMVKWNKAAKRDGVRRKMFVASMCDVFESHPMVAPWRAEALDLLAQCDGLDVQLLTKRPENIRAMAPPSWFSSWPAHVWVGTTVEDQKRADQRIPHLLDVPARVRFLSCEPLLESVDLTRIDGSENSGDVPHRFCYTNALAGKCTDATHRHGPQDGRISWVIVGGESGHRARPMQEDWVRSIRDQCASAGVPFFYKQRLDAKGRKVSLPLLDGVQHAAFPNGGAR